MAPNSDFRIIFYYKIGDVYKKPRSPNKKNELQGF